jgi:hypothetical protein
VSSQQLIHSLKNKFKSSHLGEPEETLNCSWVGFSSETIEQIICEMLISKCYLDFLALPFVQFDTKVCKKALAIFIIKQYEKMALVC